MTFLTKFAVAAYICIVAAYDCQAQLCAQLSGVNFSQNFNTMSPSGSNNTSMPSEFKFIESGTSGNLTYTADNGSLTSGETYSYGSTGNFDRAFGELTSGTVQSTLGACFVNNTNHAFTSFLIGYTGEEWRRGVSGGAADQLDFQYSTDPSATLTSGTYINVDALDFDSPNTASAGSKDGNAAANRTVFAPVAITPAAPIQPEATFYIHWTPTNLPGANDGLAIDDFTIGTTLNPSIGGDYNNNGRVDGADYVVWRKFLNQSVTIPNDITPGTVVAQDYLEMLQRFGKTNAEFGAGSGAGLAAIPEPRGLALLVFAVGFTLNLRGRDVSR